jgi:hypothetical protein
MQRSRHHSPYHRRSSCSLRLITAAAIGAMLATSLSWADDREPVSQDPMAPPVQAQEQPQQPAQEPSTPDSRPPQDEPADLTQLSLEQLLNLEITPINVLGSHTHLQGEWMLGYRYMFMKMEGDRSGTERVSHEEVLQVYPVAHTKMTMDMHMLELMFAPRDELTLMAMLPYKHMTMDHINRAGVRYTTVSKGLGDLSLMALYTLRGEVRKKENRLLLNAGLSIPTGSINKRDDTPTRRNAKLEYPMQLGSGTLDLMPGLTYLAESETWSWGAQAIATIRLGKNDNGYRFGNEHRLTAWGVYKVSDWFGPSVRLMWQRWGNVHGADPELDPATNAAFDPRRQKGRRLDLFLGANLYAPRGKLKGHRLTIEGGRPVYQSLKGPQLETDWTWSIGWSYVLQR